MLKSFALTVAFGLGAACACSFLPTQIRFDTLSPGVVRVVESMQTTNLMTMQPEWHHDTLGVYHLTAFRASMEADMRDSALIFIGRVDTLVYDTAFSPSPLITLGPSDAFPSFPFFARLSVDTVIKGTLPARSFWVKARMPTHSCATSWRVGRTFLNVANKLETTSDIKQPTTDPGPRGYYLGTAQWFDGRYLVSPKFPGLRLDITDLFPTYPATSVHRHGVPMIPLRLDGKAYRPDGRAVPNGAGSDRKSPVPLIR